MFIVPNDKSLINIVILYTLSILMTVGSILVSYCDAPLLVILGLLLIPPYVIYIYNEKKFHTMAIVTLAVNLVLLIPLHGILVSADFNTEFTSGKITTSYGIFMPDFSPPHSAVAVNSLFNPILSIITKIDILQIFRFSAVIPAFLLSITSLLFYRILLKEEEAFVSTILLITQFYIIEGCVWPARHLYSLALLLLLVYEFVIDRKTVVFLSIGVAMYYYAMGYLSVIFILLFALILAVVYKREINVYMRMEKTIAYGAILAIIIFSSTFLWYSQKGSILSLTGHINIIIRFLNEMFEGIEVKHLASYERRLVQPTHLADYLTYGSIFLLIFLSGLGTVYVLMELMKGEADNNSGKMLAQVFILASWILFASFSVPLMAGSLGISRVYEVSFIFFAAMIPIGLQVIVKIFQKIFKHRDLYLVASGIILLLSIMANTKMYYYIFNEEPLSIMFTKKGAQDNIWRVSEAESEAGLFLMKYKADPYPIYGDAYSLRKISLFWKGTSAKAYSSLFLNLPAEGLRDGYVFLDRYNLFSGNFLIYGVAWTFAPLKLSNLPCNNKIYSDNNYSEIYFISARAFIRGC
jgi:uncharacterized membrane protein